MKLGELRYSKRTSEGFVRLKEGFLDCEPNVVELDILKDWIGDLQSIYEEWHSIVFPKKDGE